MKDDTRAGAQRGDEGYLLLGLVVAMFLIGLFLAVAAPTVAKELERDKELESEHRAQQYVRAIQNYYIKFNSYPNSIDQLLSQNNQHFLRQQYKDPLTGQDYRLIHFGENKTHVKGFFGEELEGAPGGGGLGSLSNQASSFGPSSNTPSGLGGASAGSPTSGPGGSTGFSLGSGAGGVGAATSPGGASTPGSSGATPGGAGSTLGGTNATDFQGSKGGIIGVGSDKQGHGLIEWNGSANIEDWEFLYDPRTWLIRQQVPIQGGTVVESGNAFGSPNGGTQGLGSNTPSTGSGFGNGSSFGAPSQPDGSAPGRPGSGTTPQPGTANPQQ